MAVTIKDVAHASGVHVSTVSRAFSAAHLVNPETRARVIAAANTLGYRPNRAARALSTRRTGNLGLIVADIANPFFPPLIKAAQAHARRSDHHVFVADTDEQARAEEELIRSMATQVDGALLVAPRLSNRLIAELSADVPFVVVNRQPANLPAVLMDVASGARQALEHLASLGHREIALLTGPRASWTNQRLEGAATDAAEHHGLHLHRLGPNQPTEEGGSAAAPDVLASGATAVLAYNDLVALGLLQELRARGLAVPGDLSLVGVDNTHTARHCDLTTIDMPTAAAGRAAIDLLLHRITSEDDPGTVTLDTRLVVRGSTAPPAH
ncbi:LacI family transcriptional regulator [Nocardiopsis sp. TSRI0078]|uniref:LacI family DNA-binding transcriptional regulator n=1 Tax=unclassified Nocardiopsis TaxID=2649073 RepID=UPI00093E6191|nr:LacI family DNA-binding transcriptional regulator [Nocardiopsis sp. TSRI0078]OKI23422.1 LacI family transcriptional regulator [Nocardiopsis sp. TSRI0078]